MSLLVHRLTLSKIADLIVIATSTYNKNRLIIEYAKSNIILYYIGSEDNVLERYYLTAKYFKINIIIRITSDCPFISLRKLDDMNLYIKKNQYDYLTNVDKKTNIPVGFDTTIFLYKVLEQIFTFSESFK